MKVEGAFEALAAQNIGPTKIASELERIFEGKEEVPKLRTIKDWLTRYKPIDTGGDWQIDQMDPEDAAVVLAVQAASILDSDGGIGHFSVDIANWVARLATMCPDLPGTGLYFLAYFYTQRRARNEPTLDLDAYISFTPWVDSEHRDEYHRALRNGWVLKAPAILVLFNDPELYQQVIGRAFETLGFKVQYPKSEK